MSAIQDTPEWIRSIPDSWRLAPVGALFDERKEVVSDSEFPALSVTKRGVIPQLSDVAKAQNGDSRKLVRSGDFVINSRSDRKGSSGISEQDGSVSVVYTVLRPREDLDPAFVHHLLRSSAFQEEFYRWGSGIVADLWSTRYSAMKKIMLPTPSLDEQRVIADYLDRETQKIDDLIAEQCGLIETLRERRVELIAKGVTRGIDEEPLSESPMPWIGAIPKGWSNGRIKHLGQVTLGKMLQSQGKQGYVEAPYMRAANIQPDGVVSDSDFKTMWFSPSELRSLDLCQGDVVVVEGGVGGYGRAAFLSKSLHGWGYQNSVNRIRPFGDGRFIAYYLQAVRAKGLIKAYCNIVSMPHLTAEKLESMPVPIPPDDEQCRIANYLDDQTSRIDELISESEDLITLSQERRAALITAAVTGQIDVRKAT